MATVVNAGDLALQNVSPRILNTILSVDTSAIVITTNEDGSYSPSSITLTLNRTLGFGTGCTRSWEYLSNVNGSSGTYTAISSSTTLDTINVTAANYIAYKGLGSGVIFRCNVSQAGFPNSSASITVTNNVIASNTILASLTFPTYTLAANTSGALTVSYPTGNQVRLYRGATLLTSGVTYNVGGGASQTKNGLTLAVDGSGNLTLSGGSWSTTTETFTVNAVFNSATYSTGLSVTKAVAGTTGAPGTNGTNGSSGAQGTRGNLTVNLGGGWNESTANSLIASAASASGSTPTSPINGDIAYYTGGAYVRSGGSWGPATSFIDGSLVVTGTLGADRISAGTISANVSLNSGGYIKAAGNSSTTVPGLGANTWVGSFSSSSADYGLYGNGLFGGVYGYGNAGFGVRGNAGGIGSTGVVGVGNGYGVSALGGTYGLLCSGTDTDLHLNSSPIYTATSTATYTSTKPGSTSGSNAWYKVKLGASPVTYYIPVWVE